jgi:hypothetical protein
MDHKKVDIKPEPVVVQVDGHLSEEESPSPEDQKLYRAFSWNKDEAEPETQRRPDHCCGKCLMWYKRWPYLLRCILYSVTGCIVFMIPGIISILFFVGNDRIYL